MLLRISCWIEDTTTRSGTRWVFVPAGTQWRNGIAERLIGSLKQTLSNAVQKGSLLNYAELETVFHSVANVVNSRPLAVRTFGQDDYRSITVNDLFLGRSQNTTPGISYTENNNVSNRLEIMKELEDSLRSEWIKNVFPNLVPFKKWKKEFRDIQVGDIVFYEKKFSKEDYRLGRVVEAIPSDDGRNRTVTVQMRPRNSQEKVLTRPPFLKPKIPVNLVVGVQRLCVVFPVEEQEASGCVPGKERTGAGALGSESDPMN